MNWRGLLLVLGLGLPAAGLLAFGPRGRVEVPVGRTVVRYWEKWAGVEGVAMQRIVDRFNQTVGAQQGIWVDYNTVSDVEKRMLIATAGGDPPDLAGLYDHIVAQYADQGALLPLDALCHEYGIRPEPFKPVWWQIGQYDGKLYALPSTPYTIALYYNKRLFREAGLDPQRPPATTAELNACFLKLTRRGPDGRIVQLGFTTSPAMLGWWHWIWPMFFDAQLWDGQRCTLDTPAARAAVTWLVEPRRALGNRDVLDFEAGAGAIEGPQNPFLSERLAMVFQGPWLANWASTYAPQLDYGVAAFPSVSAARQNVFASADVFVVPAGARRVREAMIFLKYLMQQDVLEELCREHGKVSPFRTPGPEFYARHRNPHIRVFDELATNPHTFGYPPMPMWSQAWLETLYLHETVLRGVRDPFETLALSQAKMEQVVRQYQRMAAQRGRRPLAAAGGAAP